MRFQYLKHSLQERMVYHSNQLREAIIKLWQRGYSYSSIVDTINGSAIAQISKGTVAYQVKKFQETNSVETMKKSGRPRSVRTPNLRRSTKAKIGVRTIFNDSGRRLFGLHPHLTSMLWTLPYGEFWQGRPVKNPIQMWRASKGASRKLGLIWMKKQFVIAVLMLTRD